MRFLSFLASFFCLALLAGISNARKDPGEYGQHATDGKSDCHTSHVDSSSLEVKPTSEKSLVRDFEPRPYIFFYVDDLKPTSHEKSFIRDFEPRLSASIYVDDLKPTGHEESFVRDFKPRPSATTYIEGQIKSKE